MGNIALVLACDLIGDGNQLGPKTILRLERAVEHHRATGDTLVVAASFSPDFPQQRRGMAVMMAEWLNNVGCTNVIVLSAETFNSRGEVKAFFDYETQGTRTIISAPYHLRRVRMIIRKMYGPIFGPDKVFYTKYVKVTKDKLSVKEYFLEPLKLLHVFLPQKLRGPAVRAVRACGINPSW